MFLVVSSLSTVDSYLASIFSKNKSSIVDLQKKWFNEESYKGNSGKYPYKVATYYMATYLVLLIYLEIKAGYNGDWDYYKTKYSIDTNRKKLSCCGIDLDEIMTSFGLTVTSTDGIGQMKIESTFLIEPINYPSIPSTTTINIATYLSTPTECFNYIS